MKRVSINSQMSDEPKWDETVTAEELSDEQKAIEEIKD